jgi:hypothetical protein
MMTPDPISTAYFINSSHQFESLSVSIVARRRLGKNVTAATNRHATVEESLDVSFPMRSLSYQGK